MNWTNLVDADKLDYEISDLAYWFHDLTHFDYTFKNVPANFNLTNSSYVQSLTTWSVIPLLILLISWLSLVTYYWFKPCCCPNRERRKPKRNACAYQTASIVLILMTGICIGLCLYGNEDVDRAVSNVGSSMQSVADTLDKVDKQVTGLKTTLNIAEGHVKTVDKIFDDHIHNGTLLNWLKNQTHEASRQINKLLHDIDSVWDRSKNRVDFNKIEDDVSYYEYVRWSVTIGVQCWIIIVCFVIFLAVLRVSKWLIILFVFLSGTTGLLFTWLQSAVYFSTSIGVADFCFGMDTYLDSKLSGIENDVIDYYLNCNKHFANPFTGSLDDMNKAIGKANRTVQAIDKITSHYEHVPELLGNITLELNVSKSRVQSLQVLLDCTNVHKSYTVAATSLCLTAFQGMFLMLIGSSCMGCLFIFMIPCATCLKQNIRVRHYYIVDEEDPFVPPRSMQSSETNTFRTYGGIQQDTASASNRTLYGSIGSVTPVEPPPRYEFVGSSTASSPDMLPYNATGQFTRPDVHHYHNQPTPTAPQY